MFGNYSQSPDIKGDKKNDLTVSSVNEKTFLLERKQGDNNSCWKKYKPCKSLFFPPIENQGIKRIKKLGLFHDDISNIVFEYLPDDDKQYLNNCPDKNLCSPVCSCCYPRLENNLLATSNFDPSDCANLWAACLCNLSCIIFPVSIQVCCHASSTAAMCGSFFSGGCFGFFTGYAAGAKIEQAIERERLTSYRNNFPALSPSQLKK